MLMISVGNKADSPLRKVSSEKGQEFADKYSLPFYETSAKLDLNITEVCVIGASVNLTFGLNWE